ncbi:MAG: ankyrin repeat domain-containing protein [Gammaproteobacteria bacterium]|nr:ankyrin repeat domain-containing protein [Gammaproteobacteria bacterium]
MLKILRTVVICVLLGPTSVFADLDDRLIEAVKFGKTAEVQELLSLGADADVMDPYKRSVLLLAARRGYVSIVKLLVGRYANVNAENHLQKTALMGAALNGYLEIVEILLRENADVNAKNWLGETAIGWATINGHPKIVALLLRYGAEYDSADGHGWTPLMYAAKKSHTDIVKLLLENGADPNVPGDKGWSPLMIAAERGNTEAVEVLLAKGADLFAISLRQETALSLAERGQHFRVARVLREAGAKADAANTLATQSDIAWEKLVDAAGESLRQGKYAHAEQQLTDALALAERLGMHDPRLVVTLNKLAQLYYAQGKFRQAEPLYKRALEISAIVLGPEHPDLATNLSNLAAVYDAQGKHALAAPFHKRALTILEKLGPAGHATKPMGPAEQTQAKTLDTAL